MAEGREGISGGLKELAAIGTLTFALLYVASRPQEAEIQAAEPPEPRQTPPAEQQPSVLTVPVEQEGFPALFYVVQPGDTLFSLAQRWGTSVEHIAQVNGISDPNRIEVGQMLRIVVPVNNPNIFIRPVGNVVPQEAQHPFIFEGFDYLAQREADLFYEGVYYYSGELDRAPQHQEGLTHLYGINPEREFLNWTTSSGQPFDPNRLACASWFYPIGTTLRVSYQDRSVECIVNDRGPNRLYRYPDGRTKNVIIDLTVGTARVLEPKAGIGPGQIGEMYIRVDLLSFPPNWQQMREILPTRHNP